MAVAAAPPSATAAAMAFALTAAPAKKRRSAQSWSEQRTAGQVQGRQSCCSWSKVGGPNARHCCAVQTCWAWVELRELSPCTAAGGSSPGRTKLWLMACATAGTPSASDTAMACALAVAVVGGDAGASSCSSRRAAAAHKNRAIERQARTAPAGGSANERAECSSKSPGWLAAAASSATTAAMRHTLRRIVAGRADDKGKFARAVAAGRKGSGSRAWTGAAQ